ncbi:MAG: hypothetical protein HOW73_06745 [Polyangiaceae bacterium]|nr:hypothetical protein [Polyangiaceae bacterium]
MGQRANLVIVRDGEWKLFYDHWCANRLDVELFWGPELAVEFIEQRKHVEDRFGWLDEVWCEGGAVLDEDTRVLTWFGGEEVAFDVPLRRALFELMANQWPGWQLRWATGGIAELGACVGLPAERFLTEREPDGAFTLLTEYPEDNDTLLTVRQDGRTLVAQICGEVDGLAAGSGLLPQLLAFPRTASLRWRGDMPTGGVHIDVEERGLYYWLANPVCAIERRVQAAWPGWTTECLQDRFEVHLGLARADVHLPDRPPRELYRSLLDTLRRCHAHERQNPARELAATMGASSINPWTEESRGSVGAPDRKLELLHALEKKYCA